MKTSKSKEYPQTLGRRLEELYATYNRRCYVKPDPLQFLYDYENIGDREIVGLIAASLAYGRVAQILRSVRVVLDTMGKSPRRYVESADRRRLERDFRGFKHRFTTDRELVRLLTGLNRVIEHYGSLNDCFLAYMPGGASDIRPGLAGLADRLNGNNGKYNSLIACPAKRSACKRHFLFLRWMVRRDDVDPGGWTGISPADLIVPLDTHMHAIACGLGLTERRQADMAAALDVTAAFKRFSPEDPVRYDFALTRLGIREDMDLAGFLHEWQVPR